MIDILQILLKSVYLMLPAYFANMAPVIVRKHINFLDYPVDFNRKMGRNRIFGENKTWRGIFFGVIFGIIIAFVQSLLQGIPFFASVSFLDYSNWLIIGILMGLGALVGDLAKSFFKRRLDIKPGKSFVPFDQIDFVIGSLLFVSIIKVPTIDLIMTSLIISFILHITVNHIAFYLKIRKEKW